MIVWGVSGYDPWWGTKLPPDILDRTDAGGIAGGETMMLEQCFALASRGDEVKLFSETFAPGRFRGVQFCTMQDFVRTLLQTPHPDVIIAWRNPEALSEVPPETARILVQQCNDLDYTPGWSDFVDAIVAASANHAELLRTLGYGGAIEVVHNGCFLERYPVDRLVAPQQRRPIVGYWSSPDRGLHHLLNAWPIVRRMRPDAELRVHYEIEKIFSVTRDTMKTVGAVSLALGRVAALQHAVNAARRFPGLTFTGMLSRNDLLRAQLETRVFCYPCDPIAYTEGFGGSVAEAMAAGCLPLIRPVDAFPSLYDGAVRWITGDPADETFPQVLAEQICEALEWTGERNPTMEAVQARARRWSWANSHAETRAVVDRVVARKRGETVPPPAFPWEDPRWKGAA